MTTATSTSTSLRTRLRSMVYAAVVIVVIGFVASQGAEPWRVIARNPGAFFAVMAITMLGLTVQAGAFRACLLSREPRLPLWRLVGIWAAGGLSSFVAPLVAGLAVRVLLLKRQGLRVRQAAAATLRQTLFNIEVALAVAAGVLIVNPWPRFEWLGWLIGGLWCTAIVTRRVAVHLAGTWARDNRLRHLPPLFTSPPLRAQPWLLGQVAAMAINYWAVFLLLGNPLPPSEALLLAAVTIMAGVVVVVPNGLGILDALWVWVAGQKGMGLGEAVGLALVLRLGYMAAAASLWTGSMVLVERRRRRLE